MTNPKESGQNSGLSLKDRILMGSFGTAIVAGAGTRVVEYFNSGSPRAEVLGYDQLPVAGLAAIAFGLTLLGGATLSRSNKSK